MIILVSKYRFPNIGIKISISKSFHQNINIGISVSKYQNQMLNHWPCCESENIGISRTYSLTGAVKRYWRIMDLLLDNSEITEKIMDLSDFKRGSFEALFKVISTELLMKLRIQYIEIHIQIFREHYSNEENYENTYFVLCVLRLMAQPQMLVFIICDIVLQYNGVWIVPKL